MKILFNTVVVLQIMLFSSVVVLASNNNNEKQEECNTRTQHQAEPAEVELVSMARDPAYSIHLMWVNNVLDNTNTYIFREDECQKNFDVVFDWARGNIKSSGVSIWYDSLSVNEDQVKKTSALLEEFKEGCQLSLKDLRDMSLVKQNLGIFSDKMPVYFRVDLMRVILADDLINKGTAPGYIVYSDFNVPPLPYDKLFDQETMAQLKDQGLVLAKTAAAEVQFFYENGFYILDSRNAPMVKACRLGLIDICIEQSRSMILSGDIYKTDEDYNSPSNIIVRNKIEQIVFARYAQMIKAYFYFSCQADIIDDSKGNPASVDARLTAYNDSKELFEVTRNFAKFRLIKRLQGFFGWDSNAGKMIKEKSVIFPEGELMGAYLEKKDVEKPLSRFYTTNRTK